MVARSPYKLVHVPALLRDLPGDLVGAHGVIVWLFAEAKVVAQVDQGHGDAKPHTQQGQHRGEGNLERWEIRGAIFTHTLLWTRNVFICHFYQTVEVW